MGVLDSIPYACLFNYYTTPPLFTKHGFQTSPQKQQEIEFPYH